MRATSKSYELCHGVDIQEQRRGIAGKVFRYARMPTLLKLILLHKQASVTFRHHERVFE